MTDAARLQPGADAGLGRADAVLAHVVEARSRGVAIGVEHGHAAVDIVFLAAAQAARSPGCGGGIEIPLAAHGGKQITLGGARPALSVVGLVVRHRRNEIRRRHAGTPTTIAVALIAHIGRQTHIAAAPVKAHAQRCQTAVLVLDAGAAIASHGIQANARALVRAEATRHIGRSIGLTTGLYARTDLGEWLVASALGQQADHAPHAAAAGSGTVKKSIGTAQHFHPLEKF